MINSDITGVLLVNQGTPDSFEVADVRKYLREFLMDERVIDIPYLQRWPLVNLIIAPTRTPKSAKVYQELWTPEGSPLKVYGNQVVDLLQQSLRENYLVKLGMRYQNPSIQEALKSFKQAGVSKLIVLPLYPQYASATTGSVYQKVMELMQGWQIMPELKFINNFTDHPKFIEAFAAVGRKYMEAEKYEHYVFTYHGLPERQLHKDDTYSSCEEGRCATHYHAGNKYCYRAQCYETTRLMAQELGISPDNYTVAFQSRLGNSPWIQPYTDDVIKQLANTGIKKVLAFAPSFIADCLETTVEVGREYKELFEAHGGAHWQLAESLNTIPLWIDCLHELVTETAVKHSQALKVA
ncbi:ferrochelatase [Pontibacter aydingkolensis]|uniref:Ferrochelatase n=1 Tax=Pontibacter aydingkolensis TaxID=1911536 RepID=A0ABS7CX97_9BACT|nr:ferrochelatase [Pontibacter aydingkolensis]MBW7468443.1 ferrochelatase [Pontibacter aydingkolensis]